jgi:Na+/H+ antiporter NhaD/arsenite permease-like protein
MMDKDKPGEQNKVEEELHDLKRELENFEKEKERVRAIVGKIGGIPKTQAKLVNILFIVVVVVSVAISIVAGDDWRLIMIEVALVALSVKIIYLMHEQMRVAHFEFWILSSLEWRVNEVMKQVRQLKKDLEK